jgi:hypothetical protein
MNPWTCALLWLGTWHLEAAQFWTDLAERIEDLS